MATPVPSPAQQQQPPNKRTRRRPPPPTHHSSSRRISNLQKSSLQIQLENATESPGGTKKILHIVQTTASDHEIQVLNQSQWTPLVGAIFRFGKNTTNKNGNSLKSEQELIHLIVKCHERGLSINSGGWFGEHYHRPLVLAAYFGYHSAVRTMLLECGALVDLADGEGRTAWFASFENPVYSGGKSKRCFRDCDRRTAEVLWEMGVTCDLAVWKKQKQQYQQQQQQRVGDADESSPNNNNIGTLCYMNGDSCNGSVMLRALINKNVEVVKFLCQRGGIVTDRDFLELHRRGQMKLKDGSVLSYAVTHLVPMVKLLLAGGFNGVDHAAASGGDKDDCNKNKKSGNTMSTTEINGNSWHQSLDWSFPPTWKLGVIFCRNCGLPAEIFKHHVEPFFRRDWFYTNEQLEGPIPARLGASMGELVGSSQHLQWV